MRLREAARGWKEEKDETGRASECGRMTREKSGNGGVRFRQDRWRQRRRVSEGTCGEGGGGREACMLAQRGGKA